MPSLRYNLRNVTSVAGVVFTFVALAAANAEVKSGGLLRTLSLALASVVIAEYCWARLLWSGGRGTRAAFIVLSIPNAFALVEIIVRARALFGR